MIDAITNTFWNIVNIIRDRPWIKLDSSFGVLDDGNNISTVKLIVTATNKGTRQAYLSSVGLEGKGATLFKRQPVRLPCELARDRSISEWFDVEQLRGKSWIYAWYRDETGKIYKDHSIAKKLGNYFKGSASGVEGRNKKQ